MPAAAAAAVAATSSAASPQDNTSTTASAAVFSPLKTASMAGEDGSQIAVYNASYTSFRMDEEEGCGEEEEEEYTINQQKRSSNAAGVAAGNAAADGSDGEFQDASVDHCAVVTVQHRETHNSRSVVISQFLQLRYIDLFTYVDGSPFNWSKISSGIDSVFTAIQDTTTTIASSPPSSKPSSTQQSSAAPLSFMGLITLKAQEDQLDTITSTERDKIEGYLQLDSAYAGVNNPQKTPAALTLAAQEGTMQHRCTVSEYRYDADPRSTHRGAKRLQESSGSTGTYTHGMILEEYLDELARKSNNRNAGRAADHNNGVGSGGHRGPSTSGGSQSIIAGTASKLFGFVRKAM